MTEAKNSKEPFSHLVEFGKAFTSLTQLDHLLQLTLKSLVDFFKAEAGKVVLLPDHELKVFAGGCDPDSQTGKGFKACLCLPLNLNEETLGFITLGFKRARKFSLHKITLSQSLVVPAAFAVKYHNNLEQESFKAQEAQFLYQYSIEINSTLNAREAINNALPYFCCAAGTDRAMVLLLNERKTEFAVTGQFGFAAEQAEFINFFKFYARHLGDGMRQSLEAGQDVELTPVSGLSPPLENFLTLLPGSNMLVLPLKTAAELSGLVLIEDSRGGHFFSGGHKRICHTMAMQLASTLEKAYALSKYEENHNELEILYNCSWYLNNTLTLSRIMEVICDRVIAFIPDGVCLLLVWDDVYKNFKLEGFRGESQAPGHQKFYHLLAKLILRHKKPLFFTLKEDTLDTPVERYLKELKYHSLLLVPIIIKRRVVGILACLTRNASLTRIQQQLIKKFALLASQSIKNAQVYGVLEAKMRELAALFEVSKAITSSLQFEEVLNEIACKINKVMRSQGCSIMLLHPELRELNLKAALGLSKSNLNRRFRIDEDIRGQVIRKGRPLLLVDVQGGADTFAYPEYLRREGFKTSLSVPMKMKGDYIGVIEVCNKDIHYYSMEETSLLNTMAGQAAIAIDNARLYQKQQEIGLLLQSVLAPQQTLTAPKMEIGHCYVPSSQLGGDYYDVMPIDSRRIAFSMADVSGKGPQAAIYTVRVKYILRTLAHCGYSPQQVLDEANRLIYAEAEGEKFLSLFYAEFDTSNKVLYFSSAGHEPPLLWRKASGKMSFLKNSGVLLGIKPDAEFTSSTVKLSAGDLLILYTDGITEARNGKGDLFGLKGLRDIVAANIKLSPQTLTHKVFNVVLKFSQMKLSDDFSLMIIKVL